MNDTDFVLKQLKSDAENKHLASVEVATGITQRTMLNILNSKTTPRTSTIRNLLNYYKKGKK